MKKMISRLVSELHKRRQPFITSALLICMVLSYQNCQQQEFYAKDNLSEINNGSSISPSANPPVVETEPAAPPIKGNICENGSTNTLICNPLGGGEVTPTPSPTSPIKDLSRMGLIASIYEGKSNWNSLGRYFIEGFKHPEDLYFSNFNIPNRYFDNGFNFSDGEFLKTVKSEKLIEWFAILANGHIGLPESEADGFYHIVTISDDGIEVSIDGKVIISNTGTHAAVADCAGQLIEFKKGEAKKFQLKYFQGPRYHIALMTFIKKIEAPSAFKKSSSCSTGISPEKLAEQGYRVIAPDWFTLPDNF
jgi:hypothetical protein